MQHLQQCTNMQNNCMVFFNYLDEYWLCTRYG